MNNKKVGLMKNDGWLLVLIVVVALAWLSYDGGPDPEPQYTTSAEYCDAWDHLKRTNGFSNTYWETPDERMTDLCSKVRNESDGRGG